MSVRIITLDGPSGAGKGTAGIGLAKKLNYYYLDSGALYRLLALAAQRHKVDLDNQSAVTTLAAHFDIDFKNTAIGAMQVLLEGEDVTREIRMEHVASAASRVAMHASVRSALVDRQRLFAKSPGLVADGRDMGTVIFPDAELKIYLTASSEVRASRRHKQLLEKGENVSLHAVRIQVDERDERDRSRKSSPLRPAASAIQIDTSAMSAEEVLNKLLEIAVIRGLFH